VRSRPHHPRHRILAKLARRCPRLRWKWSRRKT